jgi:hypothetical protein
MTWAEDAALKQAWKDALGGGSLDALCEAWLKQAKLHIDAHCEADTALKAPAGPNHHAVGLSIQDKEDDHYIAIAVLLIGDADAKLAHEQLIQVKADGDNITSSDAIIKRLEAKDDQGSTVLHVHVETKAYGAVSAEGEREALVLQHTGSVRVSSDAMRWRAELKEQD